MTKNVTNMHFRLKNMTKYKTAAKINTGVQRKPASGSSALAFFSMTMSIFTHSQCAAPQPLILQWKWRESWTTHKQCRLYSLVYTASHKALYSHFKKMLYCTEHFIFHRALKYFLEYMYWTKQMFWWLTLAVLVKFMGQTFAVQMKDYPRYKNFL